MERDSDENRRVMFGPELDETFYKVFLRAKVSFELSAGPAPWYFE